MVHSIEGHLPIDDGDQAIDVPLVYENPSNGERTKIGMAHVKGNHFSAELDEEYKYFFKPQDIHFSFAAEVTAVKCGPIRYRPKDWGTTTRFAPEVLTERNG